MLSSGCCPPSASPRPSLCPVVSAMSMYGHIRFVSSFFELLVTWSNWNTWPNSWAATVWMSYAPEAPFADHLNAVLNRMSDSTGLPFPSYQLGTGECSVAVLIVLQAAPVDGALPVVLDRAGDLALVVRGDIRLVLDPAPVDVVAPLALRVSDSLDDRVLVDPRRRRSDPPLHCLPPVDRPPIASLRAVALHVRSVSARARPRARRRTECRSAPDGRKNLSPSTRRRASLSSSANRVPFLRSKVQSENPPASARRTARPPDGILNAISPLTAGGRRNPHTLEMLTALGARCCAEPGSPTALPAQAAAATMTATGMKCRLETRTDVCNHGTDEALDLAVGPPAPPDANSSAAIGHQLGGTLPKHDLRQVALSTALPCGAGQRLQPNDACNGRLGRRWQLTRRLSRAGPNTSESRCLGHSRLALGVAKAAARAR